MRARLARIRLALAATGLALLVGLGLLLARALAAGEREQALREQALLERVLDELEGTLATFVASEQARPFVQWRHTWVAPGTATREPSLSPLAELQPQRPWLVGYFQIEPEGEFRSPMIPPAGEDALVPALRERVALVREQVASAAPEPRVAVNATNQRKQAQQAALPQDIQIQRALDQQANMRLNALVNQDNLGNAAPDSAQISSFLDEPTSQDELDVRVEPFVARMTDARHLELVREVWIGERRWRQGLLIDRPALERWLAAQVLGSPELAAAIALDWQAQGVEQVHQFAAPFDLLHVRAELLATSSTSAGQRFVVVLGLLLALALIGLLIAVDRTLAGLVLRAEERERFIAAVTHELRTPLTSIRMYSEMLEQGMVVDPARQTGYHRTIRGEAERLSRLVEQVLTLARIDQATTAPRVDEPAPLHEIVARVIELLAPLAEAKGLAIEVELDEAIRTCLLPSDAVTQILTNLLDNAIKFSQPGAAPIELRAQALAGRVRVVVADHGPGVEPELLRRMFEPFVRGRMAERDATPGTGIGLAVVRSLVTELGGQILARPRSGGGLEVFLELGLRPA
jgi:signal transduction histidine kinase